MVSQKSQRLKSSAALTKKFHYGKLLHHTKYQLIWKYFKGPQRLQKLLIWTKICWK